MILPKVFLQPVVNLFIRRSVFLKSKTLAKPVFQAVKKAPLRGVFLI